MDSSTADALLAEVMRGGQASVRNLALAEAAVERGQFNLAKVLRALAHSQRAQALTAARRLAVEQDPGAALEMIATDLAVAPPAGLGREAITVRAQAQDIVRRAHASLVDHPDVPETEVAQLLWSCYGCGLIVERDRPEMCPVCGALAVEFEVFEPFYSRTPERLGRLRPAAILAILRAGPERFAAAFAGRDETQLRTKPAPGEWSPMELAAHVLETEQLFQRRAQALLAEEGRPVLDTPVPPWKLHEGMGYEAVSAAELLGRLRATRAETVALLDRLQPEAWGRAGTIGGQAVTLLDLGAWLANHDRGHLAQLQRLAPSQHD